MPTTEQVEGHLLDWQQGSIYPARVTIQGGLIHAIESLRKAPRQYLLPGLIDAHVHVESSLLPPAEFARMAVVQGTTGTVSDPHEIANVLGMEGVRYMLDNASRVPFKFCFGAPSCVPATSFERSGARLDAPLIAELLADERIGYLAEVMNFPGVLSSDSDLMAKIAAAHAAGKRVDGHAPGLRGEMAMRYAAAGISTDHECVSLEEALDKIAAGMHILIREGSAAKNFDALIPLLKSHPERVMFCSDDKHPNDLVRGHINGLLRRAVATGADVFDALRAATVNPVVHYGLRSGLLRVGDPADLIAVSDLQQFNVLSTRIDGVLVAENGKTLLPFLPSDAPNVFEAIPLREEQLLVGRRGSRLRTIVVKDGQIVTGLGEVRLSESREVCSDTERDLLKLVVQNRYDPAEPAVAFVQGFGLKTGALASTVAHDSHNIIAVGVEDRSIAAAINALVPSGGGLSICDGDGRTTVLPLPIAGLMSDQDGWAVARYYEKLDAAVKALGGALSAPYMSLSFLALLVIPRLKLSDRGLFDGESFAFTSLFSDEQVS